VSDRSNRWMIKTFALAGLLVLPGCDWVEDRFQTCSRLDVDLENRGGSGQAVHLALEHETYGPENLVPWLSTRRVEVCVERGDVKRFRAGMGSETFFIANCAVSRNEDEFEFNVARVVWDRGELACENW
jgi:hypothetical protein